MLFRPHLRFEPRQDPDRFTSGKHRPAGERRVPDAVYDLSRKYRVQAGADSIDYADTLKAAKLIAGEWQAERERAVQIVRQQGRAKRWKATLQPSGAVRLDELFCDGFPDDPKGYTSGKAMAMARLIDREHKRHKHRRDSRETADEDEKRERSRKFGKGVARAVVCLTTDPPKRFEQAVDAAAWLGVKHQSFFRSLKRRKNGKRRKCCGMVFAYEDELLTGGKDDRAIVARLRQAGAGTAQEHGDAGRSVPLRQEPEHEVPVRQRQEDQALPRAGGGHVAEIRDAQTDGG